MNNNKMGIMEAFMLKIRDIRFEDVEELYKKKEKIRTKYNILCQSEKEMFKWYFYYQLSFVKNPLKKIAWEYINDFNVENEFSVCYEEFLTKKNKIKMLESIQID